MQQLHIKAKSENGFFKVIVRPMYEIMNRIVDNAIDSCLNNLDETIISWEKIHIDQLMEYNKKNNNNHQN